MMKKRRRLLVEIGMAIADVRNRAAAEVERSAAVVADDFHAIRIAERLPASRSASPASPFLPSDRREASRAVFERRGVDQRLVALEVDDHVDIESAASDFGDAVGAGRMIASRHDRLAAKALDGRRDPRIVRGDDDGSRRP